MVSVHMRLLSCCARETTGGEAIQPVGCRTGEQESLSDVYTAAGAGVGLNGE